MIELDEAPVTETVPPLSPCNHSNNLMQLSFDTFSSKNSGLSIVVWQIFVIALLISCCCAFNSASKQTKALQNVKSFKIHLVTSLDSAISVQTVQTLMHRSPVL